MQVVLSFALGLFLSGAFSCDYNSSFICIRCRKYCTLPVYAKYTENNE